MAGRKLKPLPDDDHPRTQFAQALRDLRDRAGSPSYRALSEKVGYTLATYSSIFNGEVLPEEEQLIDLVGYLKGDTREWLQRLSDAAEAVERWDRHRGAQSDLFAEMESLKGEVEGYRVIASDPASVFAQAQRAREDAQVRINFALEMEAKLSEMLHAVDAQLNESQGLIPLAQEEARILIDQARESAQEIERSASLESKVRLEQAQASFARLVARAESEANEIIDKAGTDSRRIRADTGRIVDQLLAEAEQYIEDARAERLQAELERQKGEALVERMKLRAKIDLAQVIMGAQQALAKAGAVEYSGMLDFLLQDLGINDVSELGTRTGRHRKTRSSSKPSDAPVVSPEAPDAETAIRVVLHASDDEPEARAALPRRRSAPKEGLPGIVVPNS
ncbi:helix-turn-helix domain-containing protein [Streptomyces cyaneofuscatus]